MKRNPLSAWLRPTMVGAALLCYAAGSGFSEEPGLPPLTTATKERLPGKFVWADLVTDDVPTARKFYAQLFGWTFRDVGNYTIAANEERCRHFVQNSIGIVTALNPVIGYEKSASIAKEALKTGGSVYDLVLQKGWLTKEKLDDLLSPANMTDPRQLPN